MSPAHPAFGVDLQIRQFELSENSDRATAQTIDRMQAFANEDSRDLQIVGIARMLGGGKLPPAQFAKNVHGWVRDHVRFVQDREIAFMLGGAVDAFRVSEVLIRPREMVRMADPMGDCDDFSMLTAALLTAGGVDASFATVAANPGAPKDYSHVYDVAHLQGGDMAIDSSHGDFAGWEAPNLFGKLREWSLSGMGGMMGMGGLACACNGDGDFDGMGFVGAGVGANTVPWWQQLITSGTQLAQTVLQKPVYQSGPSGTTIYGGGGQTPTVTNPGQNVISPQLVPGVDNSVLLLGGVGLLVVLMVAGKK